MGNIIVPEEILLWLIGLDIFMVVLLCLTYHVYHSSKRPAPAKETDSSGVA